MLEIRDLTKVYRPKHGAPVLALSHVTLSFPDRGMVFLLGRSGSGKSTLLNLLGGLDRYDEGDILINGNSTAAFKQRDFDSYRNTYVGFVFQEYNLLEEFTVGANIALAIELQGKKATDEAVSRILDQVGLTGYGARRPGELSGGQKQRVAIARALVKDPKIIMADEPTGALDSYTGKDVLDTLKKLSEEKLVIVVSHDRDFALRYGDRIIELADGQVISDREYFTPSSPAEEAPKPRFMGNSVILPGGYHLTEADREQINAYMDSLAAGELAVTMDNGLSLARESRQTPPAAARTPAPITLIRSRLPLRAAFRIGAGALKFKKFRLVVTILLSCIAFGLFGLSDTFGSYDHVETCTRSIQDTGVNYASFVRLERKGDDLFPYWDQFTPSLSEADLGEIREKSGVNVRGVFAPGNIYQSFSDQFDPDRDFTQTEHNIYAQSLVGFAPLSPEDLSSGALKLLAGRAPEREDEIVISSYVCETFRIGGYRAPAAPDGTPYEPVQGPGDMVGKVLRLAGRDFTVSGVVDTNMDLERYRFLTVAREGEMGPKDMLAEFAMSSELEHLRTYSFAQVGFVTEKAMQTLQADFPVFRSVDRGYFSLDYETEDGLTGLWANGIGRLSDCDGSRIVWLGEAKKTLGEREAVISLDLAEEFLMSVRGDKALPDLSLEKEEDLAALKEALDKAELKEFYQKDDETTGEEGDNWKIVGVLLPLPGSTAAEMQSVFLLPDGWCGELVSRNDTLYQFAAGAMPADTAGVRRVVAFCEDGSGAYRFALQNSVTFELDSIHEVLAVVGKVFFGLGVGFALFAAIMLSNFIATSIQYKKQEIGILRAIGARGNDAFRIFFAESFIIALINFILAALGTFLITASFNATMRSAVGILVTILPFGIRQILLIFVISMAVAVLASFIPVKRIAGKRPIDAIRNR